MKHYKMRFQKGNHVCIIVCKGFPGEINVIKCTVDAVHSEFGTYHLLREDGRIEYVADRSIFATELEAHKCIAAYVRKIANREERQIKKLMEAEK